ncbi:LysM peptidoglycan-binding domain-containing protein [Flavobacteriaceae bacterium]|nr:LysM peptidoglycan-binding domain-containing protein [Flavobacteriaceae bacterium]
MMKRCILVLSILLWTAIQGVAGQNSALDVQIYRVKQGDELPQIIRKFKTCRAYLMALNPELKSTLVPDLSLIVPKASAMENSDELSVDFVEHKVKRKETLFGIAQSYGLSLIDLQAYNPEVTAEGLNKGDRLKIYTACNVPSPEQVQLIRDELTNKMVSWHVVMAKETLWSLGHRYNMSIEELKELNPDLTQNLVVGQRIKVRGTALDSIAVGDPNFDYYAVQPKEGFFRLRQKFGLTKEEIVALNPNAAEGLKLGMVLRLPKAVISYLESEHEALIDLRDFKTDSSAQKITLMLPLQLDGFIQDSLDLNQQYIQSNRLLRIALDFYTGVLMAQDYAKAYGLEVSLDVLDTQAKKSVVDSLLNVYDFSQSDMVIGPFLPANVIAVSEHLKRSDLPVVSPLSRPNGTVPDNLVQTIPDAVSMRRGLMDYIKNNKRDRKMLFVGDADAPGLAAMRGQWPKVKVLLPREQGYVDPDDILPQLSDSLENWVVLESRKPVIISNVIGVLNGMEYYQQKNEENDTIKKTYDVRLFTTAKNESFDFDDISNIHLSHLEFSYPSSSRPYSIGETLEPFVLTYLDRFGTTPNKYATRGFDLTLDLIFRKASTTESLTQALVMPETTQYIENKFRYELGAQGGYENKAFYLLKYTQDMGIEELINSLGARN